jgi:hypothetical protein
VVESRPSRSIEFASLLSESAHLAIYTTPVRATARALLLARGVQKYDPPGNPPQASDGSSICTPRAPQKPSRRAQLFVTEDDRARQRGPRQQREHLSTLLIDTKGARRSIKPDGLKVGEQSMNEIRARTDRPTNRVPDPDHALANPSAIERSLVHPSSLACRPERPHSRGPVCPE